MLSETIMDLPGGVYVRFRTSGKLFNLSRLQASTKVFEKYFTSFYAQMTAPWKLTASMSFSWSPKDLCRQPESMGQQYTLRNRRSRSSQLPEMPTLPPAYQWMEWLWSLSRNGSAWEACLQMMQLLTKRLRTATPGPARRLVDCTAENGIKKVFGCRLNWRYTRPFYWPICLTDAKFGSVTGGTSRHSIDFTWRIYAYCHTAKNKVARSNN